jgi:hypothetical protein
MPAEKRAVPNFPRLQSSPPNAWAAMNRRTPASSSSSGLE